MKKAAIIPPALGLALLLAACGQSRDTAFPSYMEEHAEEVPGWIADMDATLADSGRAQRWREDQRRWAEMKKAHASERAAKLARDIAEARSRDPQLLSDLRVLRARGAIGAVGALPNYLVSLADDDHAVHLKNISKNPLRVDAWKVFAGVYGVAASHCELKAVDSARRQVTDPQIAPGESLYFHNADWPPCNQGSNENPLAVEIRRGEKLVWVSESRVAEWLHVPAERIDEVLAP